MISTLPRPPAAPDVKTSGASASELLGLIRFEAKVYHNAKVCGDWLIREHQVGQTCFHVVTTGSCLVEVPGVLNTSLQLGDLLFFTREVPHSMSPAGERSREAQRHMSYLEAKDEAGTGLLCAEVVAKDRISAFLLESLPPTLLIRNDPDNAWLSPLLELIVMESDAKRFFGGGITDRLCELLFAYMLSSHLKKQGYQNSLLGLYTHPRLAPVIAAVHANPSDKWTVARMASIAAQSRTLFSNVFREVSGWTPMQYVTWWRMHLARSKLQNGEAVAALAGEMGYGSVAAFSRAFKAFFNENPGNVKYRG